MKKTIGVTCDSYKKDKFRKLQKVLKQLEIEIKQSN